MPSIKHTPILLGLLLLPLVVIIFKARTAAQPSAVPRSPTPPPEAMLIDDFSTPDFNSPLGTRWQFISDRVMGGRSTGKISTQQLPGRSALHMTGKVSLENNGGFIQARLMLRPDAKTFDASAFKGIRLSLKGNGRTYALHLRTSSTRLPWQFYQASFKTTGSWQTIDLPFKSFEPQSLTTPLDTRTLQSVAVVAVKQQFTADILIDDIRFYRNRLMLKELTPEERRVIIRKGTEPPFTGKYTDHFQKGSYLCRQCGAEIFDSSAKFKSECGWPSFDDQIPGTVKSLPDPDGRRTEIVCAACGGHLGHVFKGEGFTPKNTRYCVNSISMDFVPEPKTARAIFAGGCFWGVEYHFKKAPGVLSTTVGYTGGTLQNPTYEQVCSDKTGHAEAIEVTFDPAKTSFEKLARLFFEIHDFTQLNRQGPDVGSQYRSAVFYLDEDQKKTAESLVNILRDKGYDVKTRIAPATEFYPAETYHQDYYKKTAKTPYCHTYRKIF
jgi:peptide methionine sulfoxide reductase msrA/msrB